MNYSAGQVAGPSVSSAPSLGGNHDGQVCTDHHHSDGHAHLVSSYNLGHKQPYLPQHLSSSNVSPHIPSAIAASRGPNYFQQFLELNYSGQNPMEAALLGQIPNDDYFQMNVSAAVAYPESSQRTLLPESPYSSVFSPLSRSDSGVSIAQGAMTPAEYPESAQDSHYSTSSIVSRRSSFAGDGGDSFGLNHKRASDASSASSSGPDSHPAIVEALRRACFNREPSSNVEEYKSMSNQYPVGSFTFHHPSIHSSSSSSSSLDKPGNPASIRCAYQLGSDMMDAAAVESALGEESDEGESEEISDGLSFPRQRFASRRGQRGPPASASPLQSHSTSSTSSLSVMVNGGNAGMDFSPADFSSSMQAKGESLSPTCSALELDSPVSAAPSSSRQSVSSRSHSASATAADGHSPPQPGEGAATGKTGPKKKSKMHQCVVCNKWFPRPSGLKTHMNSHSGEKPYKCTYPNCSKSFAVRSNAKRHLRTHGIVPSSEPSPRPAAPRFAVGFETPMVNDNTHMHPDVAPKKLKWVPQSLATRTNLHALKREPSTEEEMEEDGSGGSGRGSAGNGGRGGGESEGENEMEKVMFPVPLPAVRPIGPSSYQGNDEYEERDSYAEMGAYPYHPSQWRGLPGPKPVPLSGY